MQPMRRHVETVGLRPDVARGAGEALIFRCTEFNWSPRHFAFSGCKGNAVLFDNDPRTRGASAPKVRRNRFATPSAGTGERGFVEQRERCAVRHTAANTLQFEFDQTATVQSQSRDNSA